MLRLLTMLAVVLAAGSSVAGSAWAQDCGYDPSLCGPDAVTGDVTDVTDTGATLTGTVDPNGREAKYAFQVSETSDFAQSQVFPQEAASAGSGNDPVPVAVTASDLKPGTLYHVRLAAVNDAAGEFGDTKTFTTTTTGRTTPAVVTGAASALTETSATLSGTINPAGNELSYAFAYGPTGQYGLRTPVKTLPAGTTTVNVSESISGLSKGTLYHYRLVAVTKDNLTALGADRTFTTAGTPSGGGPGGGSGPGGRVKPARVSASVSPGRDATAPYRYRVRGVLTPPAGASLDAMLAQTNPCRGKVRIRVKQGRRKVAQRKARVRSNCRYAKRVTVRKTRGRAGTLRVRVRFLGNGELKPRRASQRKVRFGPA